MDEETTSVVGDLNVVEKDPEKTLMPERLSPSGAPLFKPGQSGNPAGRPPDSERLVSVLVKRHPNIGAKAADELARILGDGDHRHWMAALREWLDRTEGTVQQSTHHHVSTDRAIVTHAQAGPDPELPGLPEGDPPQVE